MTNRIPYKLWGKYYELVRWNEVQGPWQRVVPESRHYHILAVTGEGMCGFVSIQNPSKSICHISEKEFKEDKYYERIICGECRKVINKEIK